MGTLRLALACLVVMSHLGGVANVGHLAVFGFYAISGFLITRVLHESYSFRFVPFAVNRFLRLYPMYYIVGGFTLFCLAMAPTDTAVSYHKAWVIKWEAVDIVGNALIFPFAFYDRSFRLVPPAWSVAVELLAYALLFLFTARSRTAALTTLIVSAVWHALLIVTDVAWQERYYPVASAMLPFAAGAFVHFADDVRAGLRHPIVVPILAVLWWAVLASVALMPSARGGAAWSALFYLNVVVLVGLVVLLRHSEPSGWDKFVGDLAYPVFLTHWVAGFIVHLATELPIGFYLLSLSSPVIILASVALVAATRHIERLRSRIRPSTRDRERVPSHQFSCPRV